MRPAGDKSPGAERLELSKRPNQSNPPQLNFNFKSEEKVAQSNVSSILISLELNFPNPSLWERECPFADLTIRQMSHSLPVDEDDDPKCEPIRSVKDGYDDF